jgi:4-amino-4-deoxy-L-arabinose transferase-like glycosyltransferase
VFPDSSDYDALAKSVLHGDAYEVNGLFATRMPGYPMLVASVYALVGPSIKAVLILQGVLSGVATWLVYAIARRMGTQVALVAAALAACDPLSIGFSAALLSEMPFTLLLLLALWILVKILEEGRFGWWLLLGIVWGGAVYMRASALWCVVPLAAWTVWRGRRGPEHGGFWRPILGMVVATAIVFVTLLPWQTRNFSLFHNHFFRLTTLEGISLYEAVYPLADGSPQQDKIVLPAEMQGLGEAARNDEWNRRAWRYVLNDPGRMLRLALHKAARTWSPSLNAVEYQNGNVQAVMVAWYVPLFVFGLIGLLAGRTSITIKGLLMIPVLYFTAVHSLFLGSVRYRVPLMPLVCLFAAAGVMELAKWMRRGKPRADEVV